MHRTDDDTDGVSKAAKSIWRRLRRVLPRDGPGRLHPRDAYRLWAETYDSEDNVLVAIEEGIFNKLLAQSLLEQRVVLDIGCGTGRHWRDLLARKPRDLHGVDSSPEMLARLRARFPDAQLHLRSRTTIDMCDGSVDIIVSTLMMAHVREIKDELSEWVRLLNAKGEVILTDFHPEALRAGMRTTFAHRGATFEIKNHPRSVLSLHTLFQKLRLDVLAREEGSLDVNVRDTYERHGRMDIYRKHFGIPMIIAFRLRKAE